MLLNRFCVQIHDRDRCPLDMELLGRVPNQLQLERPWGGRANGGPDGVPDPGDQGGSRLLLAPDPFISSRTKSTGPFWRPQGRVRVWPEAPPPLRLSQRPAIVLEDVPRGDGGVSGLGDQKRPMLLLTRDSFEFRGPYDLLTYCLPEQRRQRRRAGGTLAVLTREEDPMHRSRSVATWLLPLLVLATTGCTTVGKAVVWPVKETVELASDITTFTAKTTISLVAETVGYTARKTIDLGFDVAGRVLEDEIVEEVVEEAVKREAAPALKILKKVRSGSFNAAYPGCARPTGG